MKKVLMLIALLALLALGCSGSMVVPDPQVNNERLNGLAQLPVYASPAVYEDRFYPIVCFIEPFKYFTVGERHSFLSGWAKVSTSAGTCQGWAFIP